MPPLRTRRVSPARITSLLPGQVFVFGSNESGKHGKGAALQAVRYFGAVYGQAEGLQGQSYAIPTVNSSITAKLSLPEIGVCIDRFLEVAGANPDKIFLVTEIGCGLAGWTVQDIAPLFWRAAGMFYNVHLPARFWEVLQQDRIRV
jgi:hypothetical protein